VTRMLVPARGTHDGVPTGCTGLNMEDGTHYDANRAGHIDVEDPGHVSAMLRNTDGFVTDQKFAAVKAPGVTCVTCGFNGFRFQLSAPCPRCGGKMVDQGGEQGEPT
jgi:hypothetical protein